MEHTNDIILKSKIAAGIHSANNKKFLEQYDTDDKQIDYYTDLAMKLYDEFEIDGSYTEEGVRKNVATWFESKRKQMDLFRKHPYWSEEAKAIVFLQSETRGIDYDDAYRKLDKLTDYILSKVYVDDDYWLLSGVIYTINDICCKEEAQDGLVTDYFIERLHYHIGSRNVPKPVERMLRRGTKITRLVRKICENVVIHRTGEVIDATQFADDGDPRTRRSFDKYYAQFADALSELTVEKITVVSLNFLDFMTMSNGNSWSSCHFINSHGIFHENSESSYQGMYKQGCLSYALDEPSFILYTLPATFKDTDYYRCQKLTRMCCQYENGILITGKCYPNNNDALITRYRQMMQLIISQIEERPNLWTFSKKTSKVTCFAQTVNDTGHYPDYTYSSQKPTISLCRGVEIDLDASIQIGHKAYCLHCGKELEGYQHEWLQCENHRKTIRCGCCNKRLRPTDEYYLIDGSYYCPEHVFYCEFHKAYEPTSWNPVKVNMKDGEKTVCYNAEHYDLKKCPDCGLYYLYDEMKHGYCPNCIVNHNICSYCGKVIEGDIFYKKDGSKYCNHCKNYVESGLNIVKPRRYYKGDYVLLKDDLMRAWSGATPEMQEAYAGRIVQITYTGWGYEVTKLDGRAWSWDSNCFAGLVTNGSDALIGKTISECKEIFNNED